jgi:hypothetical protein
MSCSSGDYHSANAKFVSCTTADASAVPFCLLSECGLGPCPGESTTPPCAPDAAGVTWTMAGTVQCNAVGPIPLNCQFTGPTGSCGNPSTLLFDVTVLAGTSPSLQITFPFAADVGCGTPPALVGSIPLQTDVRYGGSGAISFTSPAGCGICSNGSFSGGLSVIGVCP